ncbi:hypothetical protein NKH77_40770 [Streptomyces sp. M19]
MRSLTEEGQADPDSLALHIPDTKTSRTTLPKEYAFLGTPGSDAWITPQTQDTSVVWPGWSFEGIRPGVLKGTVGIDFEGFSYAGDARSPASPSPSPAGSATRRSAN